MIRRSENGPICPHCGQRNPAAIVDHGGTGATCIHCQKPFSFWLENLPFYCTEDGRPPRCDCAVCTGKVEPTVEVEPERG